jgi:serine/threonine protein kinase
VQIDRYEILKPLGVGGMAEVFLARMRAEAGVERLVAIKRMLPQRLGNQAMQEMFIDEARISAQLRHSNIAQTLEFGKDQGYYFIVMEYIHGLSLYRIAKQLGSSRVLHPMAAFIVARLSEALQYAHTLRDAHGQPLHIVHRDLNPGNVLITHHGEVKLIDFGIARARQRVHETTVGGIKGSIGYMSPEQVENATIDHRSDIFAAGTLLFELLVGINPFQTDEPVDTLRRILDVTIEPPSWRRQMPAELARICDRALKREPDHRFENAGTMQEELDHHCHENRYGSRQLADWMNAHFPDLGPGLTRLRTSPRIALEDLPPAGGTQPESEVNLAPMDSGAPRAPDSDTLRALNADTVRKRSNPPRATSDPMLAYSDTMLASSDPELAYAETQIESSDPELAYSDRHLADPDPPTEHDTVSLRKPLTLTVDDAIASPLDATRQPTLEAATTVARPLPIREKDAEATTLERAAPVPPPVVEPRLQPTDPIWTPPDKRRMRRLHALYLGVTCVLLCVAGVIVWIIGFDEPRKPSATPLPDMSPGVVVAADAGPALRAEAPESAQRADAATRARAPVSSAPPADAATRARAPVSSAPPADAAGPRASETEARVSVRRRRNRRASKRRRSRRPAKKTTPAKKATEIKAAKKQTLGDKGAEW